ncbi:MAG: peptide deformylase [Gammaproteobacteria bacterium]|nr:MAG: peptide deformylase [Gammaproteobacteria bacterium]
MAIREVLRMGDVRLTQVAEPVTGFDTPELHALVEDLLDTMRAEDGAGLAATQIGVMQQVVIFGVEANPRYPDAEEVPLSVLINPQITAMDEETDLAWEGCLSVPGMRGVVSRYTNIHYTGLDQYGDPVDRQASGFHARVVQHECDHLQGVLYVQRMTDMGQFGFIEELEAREAIEKPLPCDNHGEDPREAPRDDNG